VIPGSPDERWLRRSFELARAAAARGDEPYGAVLVDAEGRLLAEADNTVATTRDVTGHAETNLVRRIAGRFDPATLAGATLYASAEPCAMCAGAVYWAGIGRVVFGLSNARLCGEVLGAAAPDRGEGLHMSCREVLARGDRRAAVEGPVLEDEAAAVVREFVRAVGPRGP
jgi:tRNA(Arg) A34 adenosine deaminase TadA